MDEQESARVVIGMDPHKRSVTIEVMTAEETIGGGRSTTDAGRCTRLLAYGRQWPDRLGGPELRRDSVSTSPTLAAPTQRGKPVLAVVQSNAGGRETTTVLWPGDVARATGRWD